MFWVLLVCSDERCAELYLATGPLEELETLACDCGYGLQMLGLPEPLADVDGQDGLLELMPFA